MLVENDNAKRKIPSGIFSAIFQMLENALIQVEGINFTWFDIKVSMFV